MFYVLPSFDYFFFTLRNPAITIGCNPWFCSVNVKEGTMTSLTLYNNRYLRKVTPSVARTAHRPDRIGT